MRSLGSVLLACVGVLVMASSLRLVQLAMIDSLGFSSTSRVLWVLLWVPVVAAIVVGAWLIRKRDTLAARWFDESPAVVELDATSLLRVALTIIGVVFIALAIPGFFSAVASGFTRYSYSNESGGETTQVSWDWINSLLSCIYPLVHLVVGVALLTVSKRLARRLWPDDASS
jgi:hypothetical protein